MSPTADQFRAALKVCLDASSAEPVLEEKRRLTGAAFLFAQLAEHLERGKSLTEEALARCTAAVGRLGDDQVRRTITILLGLKT
jgi:hypothetical protein